MNKLINSKFVTDWQLENGNWKFVPVLLYFLLLPFGQLLRIETMLFSVPIAVHSIDLVVLASIPVVLLSRLKPHPLRKYFYYFSAICFFSLLVAATQYPIQEVLRGSLYLLRFISYYFFFEVVYQYVMGYVERKEKVITIILRSLFATAILGWFQYFYAPDLRYLKIFNWDDHYYRLTGTILDPGFMGILMVFGVLITLIQFVKLRQKKYLALSFFFLITLGFTYARASYLSLIVGIITLLYFKKKLKFIFLIPIIIIPLLFFLPKGEGEGVNLFRTNSIFQKATNYEETAAIILEYPLFGVGFNTLCSERMQKFPDESFDSHSCSGSDSSILFIMATTGLIGLFAFLSILFHTRQSISKDIYGEILIIISVSLLTHSLFLNSLFYPWVLGVLAVLFASSLRSTNRRSGNL